jgi:cytochrome c oxidase subunit 3
MAGVIRKPADGPIEFARPENAGIFFSIYFFMTGLHGIHVLVGIGLWIWMLTIVSRRKVGDTYFGPIDFTALYWHLVDLIWIYLFPMLYLIH